MQTSTLILFLIYVISNNFPVINGWIGVEKFNGNSNQTSHCYTGSYGLGEMEKGEIKRIENVCAEAKCEENRDVKFTGCAPVAANPPCFILEGILSKPFPECCYEIRCDKDDNTID